MKPWRITTITGGVILAGLGIAMAITNPGRNAYEAYAVEQLTNYLEREACTQAPQELGGLLQRLCSSLVRTGQPQLQQLVAQNTERQNYFLFSIYRTDLSVASFLPRYHFETVGAFQNFYTYEVEER